MTLVNLAYLFYGAAFGAFWANMYWSRRSRRFVAEARAQLARLNLEHEEMRLANAVRYAEIRRKLGIHTEPS